MGAIIFRGAEFVPSLSETVGYKSGLALGEDRLREIVEELGLGEYWPDEADAWYRIRSEEYEDLFAGILGRLGAGPPRRIYSPLIDVFHRAKTDPKQREIFDALAPLYTEWLKESTAAAKPGEKIDPRPFLVEAEKLGAEGVRMAIELLELTNARESPSPATNGLRRAATSTASDPTAPMPARSTARRCGERASSSIREKPI